MCVMLLMGFAHLPEPEITVRTYHSIILPYITFDRTYKSEWSITVG